MYKALLKLLGVLLLMNTFNPAQAQQKLPSTFLWKITGNGLSHPSYLYGTMHLTDKRIFFFGDSLYHSLENADGYAMELDLDSLSTYTTKAIFKQTESKLLKNVMDKEAFKKVGAKLSKKLGKPADKITTADIREERNKAMVESYKKGGMNTFMDAYLCNIARKQGKWTGGIEDMADQKSFMDNDDNEIDPEYLLQQSSDDDEGKLIEKMIAIYSKQDLAAIDSMYNGYSDVFKESLLWKRNKKMASRIDSMSHARKMFFTVGVAHLPGEQGVIALLKSRGFTVQPVFSSTTIAPENYKFKAVQSNWVDNVSADSSFSFKTPGAASLLDMGSIPMDMYMYVDLGSGNVYYAASAPVSPALGNNTDSVLNSLVKNISQKTEIVSQKRIVLNGNDGIEILSHSEAIEMRVIAFLKDKTAFIGIFANKEKDQCYTEEADYFFRSIQPLSIKAKPVMTTTTLVDTNYRFRISFQGKEMKDIPIPGLEEAKEGSHWNILSKIFMDNDLNNIYILLTKEVTPGYYMTSDAVFFNELRESIFLKKQELVRYEPFVMDGHRAARIDFKQEEPYNTYFRSIHVVADNRTYSVIVGTFSKNDSTKSLDYLNSFKLMDIPAYTWQKSIGGDNEFTAWTPAPFKENDSTGASNFVAFDKYTTASYQVLKQVYGKYKNWDSDTALLNSCVDTYKEKGDSVISKSIDINGPNKHADILISTEDGYNYKKYKLVISADTIYTVLANITPKYLKDANVDRFFMEFALLKPATTATTIFNDKAALVLADLRSTDSTVFEEATSGMYEVEFSKKHLPALHDLLLAKMPRKDNVQGHLERIVIDLNDSSTVDLLNTLYKQNKPDSFYAIDRAQMVEILLRMDNPLAKSTVKQILLQSPPVSGKIRDIGYAMQYDSATINKEFIMQLLPLTKDSLWAGALSNVTKHLLDSNLVPKAKLLPYETNFIREAKRQFDILKKADSAEFNYNYYWLVEVLGSYNTQSSNATLQQFLSLKQLYAVSDAANILLQNNQPVSPVAINKLAASDDYRLSIYEKLKSTKKSILFPKKYATQRFFAKAYIANNDEDAGSLASIEFVKERVYSFNGTKSRFYLYKVKFEEDDTEYLAVAGAFDLNQSIFDIKEDGYAVGIYTEEEFDEESIDEMFEKFIAGYEKENEPTEPPPAVEKIGAATKN